MNLLKCLEQEHSKAQTLRIVNYVGNDATRFKELMTVFFKGEYRLSQRAAWPMSYCIIEHPELIKPYFNKLVNCLEEAGHHPAITRNILRVFEQVQIPEKYQSRVLDCCFRFIRSEAEPIAIRAFAITTATSVCVLHPELKNELVLLLNDVMTVPQKPAIKVRLRNAFKVLRSLKT